MSLLEQKRLQWAKEKAQMKSEWNPWGKPGCGAPLSLGNASRKPIIDWNSPSKPHSISPDSTKIPTDANLLNVKEEDQKYEEQELNLSNEINSVGNRSLNVNNTLNVDSFEGRRTPGSISPSLSLTHILGSQNNLPALECSDTVKMQRSFLRGANIPLDPEVRAELELKRRKQKEQQLAIQTQLEEKQKRIREENERIKREEAKEEEKFMQMNQKLIQQQLLEEEQRIQKFAPVIPKVDAQINENSAQSNQVRSIPTPELTTADSRSISCKSALMTVSEVNKATIENPNVDVSPPYIENRLLTPTKYRGSQIYLPRECGTQTDVYLFNKKDVAVDTEKELKDTGNRKSKSDGKNHKQKQDKEHEIKHKPKWGAHQSQKVYQRQSDKEVASRRFEEMRQKRLKEEALIQLNQPKVGSGRTRSSARHQRYLLARETNSPLSASYRNSSHPLSHQSSTESSTAYDSTTESSMRRQRRQWDSPRGDELPNFYTQPLAGRRNSRSYSSQSIGLDTPDFQSPEKIPHSTLIIPTWNSAVDLHEHPQPIQKTRFYNSLENMRIIVNNDNKVYARNTHGRGRRNDAWSSQSVPIDRYTFDFVPYTRSSVALREENVPTAPFVNNRILQQLSTIRQGLLMKQKQMEHFLNAGREFSLPDKTYGT